MIPYFSLPKIKERQERFFLPPRVIIGETKTYQPSVGNKIPLPTSKVFSPRTYTTTMLHSLSSKFLLNLKEWKNIKKLNLFDQFWVPSIAIDGLFIPEREVKESQARKEALYENYTDEFPSNIIIYTIQDTSGISLTFKEELPSRKTLQETDVIEEYISDVKLGDTSVIQLKIIKDSISEPLILIPVATDLPIFPYYEDEAYVELDDFTLDETSKENPQFVALVKLWEILHELWNESGIDIYDPNNAQLSHTIMKEVLEVITEIINDYPEQLLLWNTEKKTEIFKPTVPLPDDFKKKFNIVEDK